MYLGYKNQIKKTYNTIFLESANKNSILEINL